MEFTILLTPNIRRVSLNARRDVNEFALRPFLEREGRWTQQETVNEEVRQCR